jgi:hypothetical protein
MIPVLCRNRAPGSVFLLQQKEAPVSTHAPSRADAGGLVRAWSGVYFAANALILLLLVTKAQTHFLPQGLATRIGHNSEVFALAIMLGAAILARRRVPATPAWVHVVVAAALAALGLFVFYGPVPATVKTLNEPIFAGAVLWLYVLLRRPLPFAWLASVVLALVVVLGYHTDLVTLQAESIVALVLAPLCLDVTDRRLLEPAAPDWPLLRRLMILLLILVPVVLIVWLKTEPLPGLAKDLAKYCSRGTEGFWGLAVVELFFVVRFWLEGARVGRGLASGARRS